MRIADTTEYFDHISNHPRIFPMVSQDGDPPISLAGVWSRCIGLEFQGGGWVLHRLAPHYYEVHTLFLPKTRGIPEKAVEGLEYVFTATECEELVTKVPDDLPHALALAKTMGFQPWFHRDNAWRRSTGSIGMEYLRMSLTDWLVGNERMRLKGQRFHEALEHVDHAEDAVHDIYVGFAVACAQQNMEAKGLYLYNKWALLAGYRPLQLDADGCLRFEDTVITKESVACL